MICRRSRPVLVLHERKTRVTLMARLAGKTAAETVAAMMATFRRLDPRMRGSITFDNDTCFARHTLLRGMLSATTYFCDAYASWQKGGIENANGRIRRWLPRGTDLDAISEARHPGPRHDHQPARANASDTDPRSRRSSLSSAGTSKSGLHDPLRFAVESNLPTVTSRSASTRRPARSPSTFPRPPAMTASRSIRNRWNAAAGESGP